MIAQIKGKLIDKTPTYVVIDCGGIGYEVKISLNTFSQIGEGETCLLYTHFVVREDAQLLYGFKETSERELFRLLISVSGVGSSTAMMILSSLSPSETKQAILNDDVNTLKSVKGIGAKSAERIIIDLRDKIGKVESGTTISLQSNNTVKDEALSALVMLGFGKNPAEKALDKIIKTGDDFTVEELIKRALKSL
ncbi:MAG: Holliday junction branch migration protein RuvA [Flavobacteriales bacterium]